MQWTITMTKPSNESKTAKRIWKSADRRSVIARTADIQVRARRGSTTQELQRDALSRERKRKFSSTPASPASMWDANSASWSHGASEDFFSKCILVHDVFWAPVTGKQEDALHTHTTKTGDTRFYRRDYFSMVQSCIKFEVGKKDADTSLPLSRASHSMSLVHNDGISQGGETKYSHCRLPKGRGTVAAETGLSRWLSVFGL